MVRLSLHNGVMSRMRFFLLLVGLALSAVAYAQLPKRDLSIELRQVEEGREAAEGYRAGSSQSDAWFSQSISVRNGEKGTLRAQQSVPMQWVQSVQSQANSLTVPSAAASSSSGGVTQALHWFDVGQVITVTPKWPGGSKEVALEIEVQQANIKSGSNTDLPSQIRNQVSTTVTVPLNQWVTVAASGKSAAAAGSYRSDSAVDARRLLQVRVLTVGLK